jgi:hypothetical protein
MKKRYYKKKCSVIYNILRIAYKKIKKERNISILNIVPNFRIISRKGENYNIIINYIMK